MKIKINIGKNEQGFLIFPDDEGFRVVVSTDTIWKRHVLVDYRTMYNKCFYTKRMIKYETN
jgi:hypothetical protein